MAKISRRAAILGVVGAGLGVGIGTGVVVSRRPAGPADVAPAPAAPSPTGTPEAVPSPRPSPSPSLDSRPRWPLTGVLLDDAERAKRPAVAVKVPDNRYEHPQRGIDQADIVFVQLEGYKDAFGYSGTRLVPVFHSRLAASVSPVRSIRPVDIPLLSPMDAIIGNTGAAPWVINYVQHYRAHLEGMLSYLATVGTGAYGTDRSRVYTFEGQTYYDRAIVCHPAILAKQTKRFRAGPQQPYFPFATGKEAVSTDGAARARSILIPYKGAGYPMGYTYDAGTKRYLRSMPWGPHVMADGVRVSTDNVLIIKAKQRYGKIFKGKGHDEPLHEVIDASGTFYYCHRGRFVKGTWRKRGVREPFTFTLAGGEPLRMAPGQTFVELPDRAASIRIRAKITPTTS